MYSNKINSAECVCDYARETIIPSPKHRNQTTAAETKHRHKQASIYKANSFPLKAKDTPPR